MTHNGKSYILGVDLGVVTLGWAAVELHDNEPYGLLDMGVRCWELTNATSEDVERGKEEPPGQARRKARLARRQLFRRAQRLRRTFRTLQTMGIFADGPRCGVARKAYLDSLDGEAKKWLREQFPELQTDPLVDHTFIYHLRAAALDRPLPLPLLGRVFFHLAQRRGYLSNRRAGSKDDDKKENKSSVVKASISELEKEIRAAGARTLGEYLAKLDPHEQRIRKRWTSRRMYQQEFDAIWAAQKTHYPNVLTPQNEEKLRKAIFFQRPLKPQTGLIGRCPLETLTVKDSNGNRKVIYPFRRAPLASLEAQRIRYLQRINDLEIIQPDGRIRPLTPEEREKLCKLAETKEKITFANIRQALKLSKKAGEWKFNLEAGGETKLPGNTTACRIRGILGPAWDDLGEEKQKQLVDTLIGYISPEALARHLETVWKFDPKTAAELANLELEEGYHSFSRRAIRKLLPRLKAGERLNAAIKNVYGNAPGATLQIRQHPLLPPVRQVMPTVRNPLLVRALTELRKVVNALIRKYGPPTLIRVELARDLKRTRKQREEYAEQMRKQEKRREEAKEQIKSFLGREPSRADIEKYLLAEECNWRCPYTGEQFAIEALLGEYPQFDVEHIWPLDRSLDDSFANKTLCYHEENRHVKMGRTPFEAYGHDPKRWQEILQRVKEFKGPYAREKLRRFQAEEIPADWPQRHLNDTRWISRAAADYLGCLYGGRVDPSGRQRIFTVTGGLTALVRRAWNLNAILGGGVEKEREDHRHHAIDAVVIALTDAGLVQRLSHQARRLLRVSARLAPQLDPPWKNFLDDVRQKVERIIVSWRPSRRLSGALHDQTNYAPPNAEGQTKVRKRLDELTQQMVEAIVDPHLRELVKQKLNGGDPKKVFSNPDNLPRIKGKDGREFVVKSVRIWVSAQVLPVGKGHRTRYVIPGNNHHIEIYAVLDANGNEKAWQGKVVSLYEAVQRKKRGEPVVCRDHGPNTRFKFSLSKSDYLQWVTEEGQRQILRVIGISDNNLEFRLPHDARSITLIRREKERIVATYARLLQRHARKVQVTPLGEILPAND